MKLTTYRFERVLETQMNRTYEALKVASAHGTLDGDPNGALKMSATLQNTTPFEALAGIMGEDVAILFGMMRSERWPQISEWDERITRVSTNLARLRALVEELCVPEPDPDVQQPPATGSLDTSTIVRGVAGEMFPVAPDATTTPPKGVSV